MTPAKNKLFNPVVYFIVFLGVFWCVFFLEDAIYYFSPSKKVSNSNYTDDFEKAVPNNSVTINGQKINVTNGMIKMSGVDFFNKLKKEISINPDKQLINSKASGNRFFLTYRFKKITVSALIIANTDNTARYQLYKSGGKVKDGGELPGSDIPFPADAVSLINLKGKKGKLMFSFNTHMTSDEVISFYRKEMKSRGWSEEEFSLPLDNSVFNTENLHETVEVAFMKNRKSFFISIKMDPENATSMVTVFKS